MDTGSFIVVSDLRIMRYLLQHGASPAQLGRNGVPPLLYMVRGDKKEDPDKVALLLEYGAPVNAADEKGRTALHLAAAAGHLRVLTVLLEHGADPALRDEQGKTALSLAHAAGKIEAETLLKR
jgi:ankyrin repeat protein